MGEEGIDATSQWIYIIVSMTEGGQELKNQNVAFEPPGADLEIRTMESDFKTLKMSGGDL